MNTNKSKVFDLNKTENLVNEFVSKIFDLDKSKKSLEEKISAIDILIDNLIDFCIKKKIFYYVENKISYTNITQNFKIHLVKFIKKLIDPSGNMINKYIINNSDFGLNVNSNNGWDNVSDINSLMFKNFKKLNESFEKNVSFNDEKNISYNNGDDLQLTNYDDGFEGFEYNTKSSTINKNLLNVVQEDDIKDEVVDTKNLSLYIKILLNQNKYLIEFVEKLTKMCIIISDPEIKYKKSNPFD
jgi:hypothetical protein